MDSRYLPQIRLPEVGIEGQEKLKNANVIIVGCGALGSPIAMYLAGAGIGHITLADFDTVDISNLHRQVFYKEDQVGLKKIDILKKNMQDLNQKVKISVIDKLVTAKLLENLDVKFNIFVDAADNPETTYILDKYCVRNQIPFSSAGVSGWKAQIFTYFPGSLAYSDIFSRPQSGSHILPCSLEGILGPVAAYAASLQSIEVIKTILGIGEHSSSLITADLLKGDFIRIC